MTVAEAPVSKASRRYKMTIGLNVLNHLGINLYSNVPAWAAVISKYRGDVIHHGYFPFSEGDRDVDDVVRVVMHLHDVTSRAIFKILGYDGRYRPRVSSSTQGVDWVVSTTPPADLGYR